MIAVCLLLGRLLPYLVSTRQGIQQVRSAVPAFDLWQRYMALEADHPALAPAPVTRGPACVLHIRRVRLPRALVALEVSDLVLAPGEMTVVFGDSGLGKDRKSVGWGKSVSVRVDLGGRRIIKK